MRHLPYDWYPYMLNVIFDYVYMTTLSCYCILCRTQNKMDSINTFLHCVDTRLHRTLLSVSCLSTVTIFWYMVFLEALVYHYT